MDYVESVSVKREDSSEDHQVDNGTGLIETGREFLSRQSAR